MDNKDKINKCVPWIDPEERVTAHFLDETSLVAEVTGCTEQVADLSFAPRVPHMKQHVSVPLSRTEVSEDLGRYTRDPARSFKRNRLMWVVDENRSVQPASTWAGRRGKSMDQDAQQLYDKLEEYQKQLQTFKAQADQLEPSTKAYVDPYIK